MYELCKLMLKTELKINLDYDESERLKTSTASSEGYSVMDRCQLAANNINDLNPKILPEISET